MLDPLNDQQLIEQLRELDQPCVPDADRLTQAVAKRRAKRRARNQTQKRIATRVGIAAVLLAGAAVAWNFAGVAPMEAPSQIATKTKTADDRKLADLEDSPSTSPQPHSLTDELLSQMVLEAQQARIRELKNEIAASQSTQSRQQKMLLRERLSRTVIDVTPFSF